MTDVLVDAEARRRIEHDLDTTFVVEAAAGTGKTTALVRRIAALVCERGVDVAHVVAASFTERAAGEIVLRLRAELERRRFGPSAGERQRAEKAIAHLEEARIGTLHGVASALLKERPIEAGIEPDFTVLGEPDARALRARALRSWLPEALAVSLPGVTRFLRRPSRDGDPMDRLESVFDKIAEHRDLDAPWSHGAVFPVRLSGSARDRDGEIDALVDAIGTLAGYATRARTASEPMPLLFAELARWHDGLVQRERHGRRDHDSLELDLAAFVGTAWMYGWQAKGRGKEYGKGLTIAEVVAQKDALHRRLSTFRDVSSADLAASLREELAAPLERYRRLKVEAGALDFLDIAIHLEALLRSSAEARASIREAARYVLCDEAQDCDPRELDLLRWLALDDPKDADPRTGRLAPGRLFVVGDPKQAIYGFRRASLGAYLTLRDELTIRGAERLELRSSFRSVPAICAVVDRALGPELTESPHQAGYVPLAPTAPEDESLASVVALPVGWPFSEKGYYHAKVVEEALPALVARFVAWIVGPSGWRVRDLETGERRRAVASDVALLFKGLRRYEHDVGAAFARELERLEIPHTYPGGISFHAQTEVAALRVALAAIEWPDDELAVFATLRGPFLALSDAALLTYSDRHGGLRPFKTPRGDARAALEPDVAEVAVALELLRELHVARARRPIPATIDAFLEASRARVALALASGGEIALARIARVVEQARRAEAEGALSFRAFVLRLEAQAEAQGDETRRGRDAVEGVRLLSAHGAKGLEFPIVVLADPTAAATRRDPGRFLDVGLGLWAEPLDGISPAPLVLHAEEALAIDHAEARRLLYVAATRARDVLVVPTTGIQPTAGWTQPLEATLHQLGKRAFAVEAPQLPPFGERTVLTNDDDPERDTGVRPGAYADGAARVVWWDPALLGGTTPERRALRGVDLVAPGSDDDGKAGARAHAERRARITSSASVGARDILPLQVAARLPLAMAAVDVEAEEISAPLAVEHAAARGRRASALLARLLPRLGQADLDAHFRLEAEDVRADEAERALVRAALTSIASLPCVAELSALALRRDVTVALAVGARTSSEGRVALVGVPDVGVVSCVDATLATGEDLAIARGALSLSATAVARALGRDVRAHLVAL